MAAGQALFLALDLVAMPALAGAMRMQPLPSDTLVLIRVVAGCRETLRYAVDTTGRRPERIREAAVLYIQQIMFHPEADNYRVLGVSPEVPQVQLREHMRWLMLWLHPDRSRSDWESVFAERVLSGWNDLKTADRRRRYDATLGPNRLTTSTAAKRPARANLVRPASRIPWITRAPEPVRLARRPSRGARLFAVAVATVVVALAVLVWPNWTPSRLWSGASRSAGEASTGSGPPVPSPPEEAARDGHVERTAVSGEP